MPKKNEKQIKKEKQCTWFCIMPTSTIAKIINPPKISEKYKNN